MRPEINKKDYNKGYKKGMRDTVIACTLVGLFTTIAYHFVSDVFQELNKEYNNKNTEQFVIKNDEYAQAPKRIVTASLKNN